jgi:hypothetical protein
MLKTFIAGILAAILGAAAVFALGEPETESPPPDPAPQEKAPDQNGDEPVLVDLPIDGDCVGGCAVVQREYEHVQPEAMEEMLQAVVATDFGSESHALDEFLFYWEDTAPWLSERGPVGIDSNWFNFLRKELAHQTVHMSVRVRDMDGRELITMDHVVQIGVKAHVEATLKTEIQLPEFSGTVERTGLYHLWTRL